ncbi:MAG TPA: GNAT family N-acetyltransferase [Longimicrobiaceae bacterium]|nr:GNAT family N-acetyltransferase [Longimicrobiaceae bacterium]
MTATAPEAALTIRPAGEGDAEGLAPLMTHLGYPSTPEQMRARLARIAAHADYRTLAAERAGRLVGMAGVKRGWAYNYDAPYARIVALVVAPQERGRGTGAALVAAAEEWARGEGAAAVHLTTALHRDGAHHFYRRIGYEQTGVRFVKRLG